MRTATALTTLSLLVVGLFVALSFGQQTRPATAPGAATVLITGANRGLGLEFARQMKAAGMNVIGTARKPAKATELAALGVRVVQLDVTDPASIERLVQSLDGVALDLLINNAGIGNRAPALDDLDIALVERTMAVNFLGPVRVTKALLPNLRKGTGKQIVSISSRLGSIELNTGGSFFGYRESKAALNMFTRTIAAQLKDDGFTCIVMSPGWVRTDMGGPDANLSPEESITGMRAVIEKLEPSDTGSFFSHDGDKIPW